MNTAEKRFWRDRRRTQQERDKLLAACKAMRDGWEHNLTAPMAQINAAIKFCESRRQ